MTRILTIAQVVWLEMIRRKDVYVLLILLMAFLVVLMSLNIFSLGGVVGYVKDLGLTLAWIFAWVLAVSVSARQIPQEENRLTIYPLLAKPITRVEFIVGKWMGSWWITAAATAVFYLALAAVVLVRGGYFMPTVLVQGLVLHLWALGIIVAVGVLFSTRMNSDAAITLTSVLTLAAFLVLPRVPTFVGQETGFSRTGLMALYYVLPHLELFDMRRRLIHDWEPAPWGAVGAVLVYGCLIMAGVLMLAWLAYRGKRFSRNSLS